MNFKTFLTVLKRNKLYTFINLFGLSLSLAFVILLGLYIQKETSVDEQHVNGDRIYRLQTTESVTLPPRLVTDLKSRYPEIEMSTRMMRQYIWVQRTPEEGAEESIPLVDPDFFQMFSFRMTEGRPEDVMHTVKDIVLTRNYALKLFGTQSAIGQHVTINGDDSFVVSGVVEDFTDSHLQSPSILMSFETVKGDFLENYGTWNTSIYLMSWPQADLAAKIDDINVFAERDLNYNPIKTARDEHLELIPLKDLYFSRLPAPNYTRTNNPTFIFILGITALLVLIFAVINYINLTTAQTGARAKEFAIRRLLGSTRLSMFVECMAESTLFCLISLVVGFLLAHSLQPFFADMMNTSVDLVTRGLTGLNVFRAIGLLLVLGVVCGLVPAVLIAAVKPIEIVRGTFRRKTKMLYSNIFIGLQLCITIILLCGTITVTRQVQYMKTSDLGYNQDYVVTCSFGNVFSLSEKETLRAELAAIPGVEHISFCKGYPTYGGVNQMFDDKDGVTHDFNRYQVDTAFMRILGIRILHRTGIGDADAVWLNETAWKRLGLDDNATEYRGCSWWPFKIAGMIQDFHDFDFSHTIGETMIEPLANDKLPSHVLLKIAPTDPFATMARIKKTYNKLAMGDVFDGRFLSDQVANMYIQQTRLSRMMGALSGVALVISALGILAMATYYTHQRIQEAAVRKVFGATNSQVLVLMLNRFLKLIAVAFIIAMPVGWYFMQHWLENFAYRISLSWTIFVLAGSIVLLIAGSTVFWQSLRTANTHPATALKNQ